MAHCGSFRATSAKAFSAISYWNEWRSATARLKEGWTGAAQETVKFTVPNRSIPSTRGAADAFWSCPRTREAKSMTSAQVVRLFQIRMRYLRNRIHGQPRSPAPGSPSSTAGKPERGIAQDTQALQECQKARFGPNSMLGSPQCQKHEIRRLFSENVVRRICQQLSKVGSRCCLPGGRAPSCRMRSGLSDLNATFIGFGSPTNRPE